ncbi:MAG: hypothetical protein OXH09_05715 [Gammaproteobacteria bacterium]|nr:hypothetical protein [Gammaproteobacteria bacterium]MCY4121386.1 hypothetical protein [Acidobacteriota bacterium]
MFATIDTRRMAVADNKNNRAAARPPFDSAIRTLLCCFALLGVGAHAVEADRSWVDAIGDWLGDSNEKVTPSHVFRATLDLIGEIRILREELGADDYPPEAERQEDRAPVHVYAKTLEVMSKVARAQRRLGMEAAEVGQIPIKVVEPRDVLGSVAGVLAELRKIKAQMVIEREIDPAPFAGGKTPSLVYKNLADASFLLDGLAGRPLTPNDVYLNTLYILDELELIAAKLRARLSLDAPAVEGRKMPKDVAQQVLRASYKMVNLQTRLGMDASSVPNLTLVRVTPSEVYDATNMLLAELTRIKHHLDINVPRQNRPDPRNKAPTDVFGQVLLIIENLDRMAQSAA